MRLLLIKIYLLIIGIQTTIKLSKATLQTKKYTNLACYTIIALLRTIFIPTIKLGIYLIKQRYVVIINKIIAITYPQLTTIKLYDYITIPPYFKHVILKFKQYTNIAQKIFQKKKIRNYKKKTIF